MINLFDDNYFMRRALDEAKIALQKDEVPVGAVIVSNNQIIARSHNLTETLTDVTAHAEMQSITSAANHIVAGHHDVFGGGILGNRRTHGTSSVGGGDAGGDAIGGFN